MHEFGLSIVERSATLGVRIVWDGDGLRLVARQGLPCTITKQGSVIQSMRKKWRGNIGPTDYAGRGILSYLPLQQELEAMSPDESDKGPEQEDIGQNRPP